MKHFHVKRLQRTLDNIHNDLRRWKQTAWFVSPEWADREGQQSDKLVKVDPRTCGTAGCLAGWAVADAGAVFIAQAGEYLDFVAPKGHVKAVLEGREEPVYVRQFARGWFGLSESQATAQFESGNTYTELWAYAMIFSGGRLIIPLQITEDQEKGAAEQGSSATKTDDFPCEVNEAMLDLAEWSWQVQQLRGEQPDVFDAAFDAAFAQAKARGKVLASA